MNAFADGAGWNRRAMHLRPLVVALIAAAALLSAPAWAEPPTRSAIDAAELAIVVRSGREIRGRAIPSAALAEAIALPPDPAGNDRTIAVADSEITGPLELTRRRIQRGLIFRDVTFADKVDLTGSSTEGKLTFAGKTRFVRGAT